MKVDAPLYSFDQPEDEVRRLEAKGYAGAFTYEGPHDPFFPLLLAAKASQSIDLYTAVAIGFARNPMILANIGWDLQAVTKGRFLLGLGTQIRPHIEKRFNMPWSKPVTRMKEMVLAIKEIWRTWESKERLDFRGEIYQHTLMTPMFNPGPAEYGPPPIFLAGVGPKMTEACGEVADGFLTHPFSTMRSFEELTLASLGRGLEKGDVNRRICPSRCRSWSVPVGMTRRSRPRGNRRSSRSPFMGQRPPISLCSIVTVGATCKPS